MKLLALLAKTALATGVVAAGLNTGQWLNRNLHADAGSRGTLANQAAEEDGPPPATRESFLHYQFVQGEQHHYMLDANVRGTGVESLSGESGVALQFRSGLRVHTEAVDTDGNGYLDIRFTDVAMEGRFMDSPVSLLHSASGTEYHHGNEHINTAQGDSISGIPQLEFFRKPTKAKVSPAGEVLDVSGAAGMDQLIAPERVLSSVTFPDGDLEEGTRWESAFGMPIPGMGQLVPTKTVNELMGFELYRGRYCAVIRQTFDAQQQGGQLEVPESALGEQTAFNVPRFKVGGENVVYFDVDAGQLVEAQLDLDFSMRIGEELKAVKDLLNVYGELLNEIEGIEQEENAEDNLLDLGVNIQGRLSLVDS